MEEGILELEATTKGEYVENLIRYGGFENLFDARWSEEKRTGLANYIGAKVNLTRLNTKLETQRKRLDLYKGQLKLLQNGIFPAENKEEAIKEMNLKI